MQPFFFLDLSADYLPMKKSSRISDSFENSVSRALADLCFDVHAGKTLGLAVSGGADSVSLLISCDALSRKFNFPLKVITVNHNIRSAQESGGDADFVEETCAQLKNNGTDIAFFRKDLEPGTVKFLAEKEGCGIEAAARKLRYQAFEKFMQEARVSVIALAHNRNDQIETLLMRFMQGSGSSGLSGIQKKRDCFIRPLLGLSRKEIEAYLNEKGISWRTDKTNFDNAYLRNRIRNELVPFLNEKFPGFDTALLCGGEKSAMDDEFLESMADRYVWKKVRDGLCLSRNEFSEAAWAVKLRVLYRGYNAFGAEGRLPFSAVKEFLRLEENEKETVQMEVGDYVFSASLEYICIKKREIVATDSDFFAIIYRDGVYDFPFGRLVCRAAENGKVVFEYGDESFVIERKTLPFCVRSAQPDDRVKTSSESFRSLKDVYSSWHVPELERWKIPLVQDLTDPLQEINAVLGCVRGFKNWIVK